MNIRKLRLDDLAVESFATTGDGASRRGTVHARSHDGDTEESLCYCTFTGEQMASCKGLSCDEWGATCGYPCRFSDATNCHRC